MDGAHQEKKIGNLKQLIYILVLVLSFNGWSQKAYVDAAISASTVTSNDQFTYKITTDCDCDIIPPDLSNFDVLQAMPGHYESMQSFNGQSTKKTCTSTMTYVLRGKKKGKFEQCENRSRFLHMFIHKRDRYVKKGRGK